VRSVWSTGLVLLGLLVLSTERASADGFRNPFQSAAAIGQGNAFLAQADDPSAIHYNPAGMVQLRGVQHSVGLELVSPRTTFTSPSGVSVHNDLNGPVGLPPPGQLFLTANVGDLGVSSLKNFTVGLGVESLYGFAAKYPSQGPLSSSVTTASLPLLDVKPTVAYRINDYLSVGLGADIFTFASFIGEGHAERKFLSAGGGGIPAGADLELNGKGTTAGFNASVLFTPLHTEDGKPLVNMGFVWRSQAVLPLNGEFRVNGAHVANASTALRFPESYEVGVAAWPVRTSTREWKLEVDVNYVRWQSIRNADVNLSNGVALPSPQFWSNAVTIAVGTEYRWLQHPQDRGWDIAARAGYLRSSQAIPSVNFDPAITDAPVHGISVGLGFLCRKASGLSGFWNCGKNESESWKSVGVDLAYLLLLFEPRTVSGNVNPSVDGTYRTITHAGGITIRISF
jgi:long-chain fatty acid transport protein